jgi:hypothetical protein
MIAAYVIALEYCGNLINFIMPVRRKNINVDKEKLLIERGWYQWYSQKYWCHQQFNTSERDCHNFGMSLDEAYEFETCPAKRRKILEGIELKSYALKALSNLRRQEK